MGRNQEILLVLKEGPLRARDFETAGIPRANLRRLVLLGKVERIARGLYALPQPPMTENDTLVEVAKRVPSAVFCLLTALRFHGVTTQNPHEIWIAIEGRSWKPGFDRPKLQVLRFSGPAFHSNIEEHRVGKTPIRVYGLAKTVADCFRFRNRVGLDVALEALRESIRSRKVSRDDILLAARERGVYRTVYPYVEAMS